MSNLIERRDRIRQAVPHLASASGAIASFQTDMRSPLEEIKIHFNPVQAAGTPSPSSPIPISGWTGCDLSSSKKNLFELSWILTPTGSLSDGVLTDVMYRLYQAFAASVKPIPNTIYKSQISISVTAKTDKAYTSDGRGFTVKAKYDDGSESNVVYFANAITDYTTVTGVTASNKKVVSLHIEYGSGGSNRWWIKDFMVVSGATVEPYEPFVGNQIPVSWSSLGTVYGGYVNEDGEVWAEWVNIASYNGETLPGEWKSDRDVYAAGTTPTIGAQVVYKLSAPVLVGTISPITLKALIGQNNIWSNANGNTEVKFWTH